MKYKVGDKVRVIEFERLEKKFSAGRFFSNARRFTEQMQEFCGKVVTIKTVENGYYTINEFGYCWDDNMLEPVNTQKIVITSDGKETLARLYEGEKVVKKATAKCSPDDTFDFKTGAMLAFERLMNDGKKPKEKPFKFEVGKKYIGFNIGGDEIVIKITRQCKRGLINEYEYELLAGKDYGPHGFEEVSDFASGLKPYEPPKYYNGKAVCVRGGEDFTVGKVYEFVDGLTKDNDGRKRPTNGPLKKLDDYTGSIYEFIPYVE